jgi:hypothetical protein
LNNIIYFVMEQGSSFLKYQLMNTLLRQHVQEAPPY